MGLETDKSTTKGDLRGRETTQRTDEGEPTKGHKEKRT